MKSTWYITFRSLKTGIPFSFPSMEEEFVKVSPRKYRTSSGELFNADPKAQVKVISEQNPSTLY
jgi:hypothetical protein